MKIIQESEWEKGEVKRNLDAHLLAREIDKGNTYSFNKIHNISSKEKMLYKIVLELYKFRTIQKYLSVFYLISKKYC